jgi:hypothetical protein
MLKKKRSEFVTAAATGTVLLSFSPSRCQKKQLVLSEKKVQARIDETDN